MQALEGLEQLVRMQRVKPGAVVAHEIRRIAGVVQGAEFNLCGIDPSSVFPGIADQVFKHVANQAAIGPGCQAILNGDVDPACRICGAQFLYDLACA